MWRKSSIFYGLTRHNRDKNTHFRVWRLLTKIYGNNAALWYMELWCAKTHKDAFNEHRAYYEYEPGGHISMVTKRI